jgi:hypothetical protein
MRLQPRDLFEVQGDYEILASHDVVREVTNGITIDYTKVPADASGDKIIKKGMPLSKITASGKFRPYTNNKLAANVAASATSATFVDPIQWVVGDTIKLDNGTTNETKVLVTVDPATKTVTFVALTNAYTTANGIISTIDGGESPTVILKRQVNVRDGDNVVGGFEIAKVISARIPVAVDAALKAKMPGITFA